ncbi:hypothetical protein [Streptomyces sp. KR80]|uniref:hypothetical protein n=1 Tax=Streptomyces sp. KR80 TaxID=3457426 RepID=UPI003FD6B5B0
MTPATALPSAALCALRTAARWRALRVAVFLGALLTLGFVYAEQAEAVEMPTPPTASQLQDGQPSPVAGLRQPRPNESGSRSEGGSVDSVLRSAMSTSETEGRSAEAAESGTDASATAAHRVQQATSAMKRPTVARQAGSDAAPPAAEGAKVVAGTGQSVVGVTWRAGQPWFAFVEETVGALPVAVPDLMPPGVTSDGSLPDAADCRTKSRASLQRAALRLNSQPRLGTEVRPAFRPVSLPGPPGEHGQGRSPGAPADDCPLRSPTDTRGTPRAKTKTEGIDDPHAHAILYGASFGSLLSGSGLAATTAPLLHGYREIDEFPG